MDGGASSDASDALGWARARDQWNIVAFEPLPRNCLRSARVLSPFAPRVRLVCSALSNVKGPAVFDDQTQWAVLALALRMRMAYGTVAFP